MGCDIHFYTEVFLKGVWTAGDEWLKDEDGNLAVDYERRLYSGRNYNLFSILADVRNYGNITPIEEPRGMPGNVCRQIYDAHAGWGSDAHSASWFTVQELLEFDWCQEDELVGTVSGPVLYEWNLKGRKEGQCPSSSCQAVGGGGVVHMSDAELSEKTAAFAKTLKEEEDLDIWDSGFKTAMADKFGSHYAEVKWAMPYYRMARPFWAETMPRLLALGKPDAVRIVFWFDN